MKLALNQAKKGRIHILKAMLQACPKSKEQLSSYAPRIETIQVKPSKIGIIIGPGGKQIRAIIEESGASIDINDSGLVSISATTQEAMDKARAMIHNLTAEIEIGQTYRGEVVSLVPFGAFIQIFGKEGLCHISELAHHSIRDPSEICKKGDFLEVKVLDINDRGQIRLSRKALLSPEESPREPREEMRSQRSTSREPAAFRAPLPPPPLARPPSSRDA
jgi:polyribonucleotide nucleotidyltransferase